VINTCGNVKYLWGKTEQKISVRITYDGTSEIHLMAIHCATAERCRLIKKRKEKKEKKKKERKKRKEKEKKERKKERKKEKKERKKDRNK